MANRKQPDYIPRRDFLFLAWAKNYHTVCGQSAAAWNLPEQRLLDMGAGITSLGDVLDICYSEHRTKADTAVKNGQRTFLEAECRAFNREFTQYSSLVTDDDRVRLQIPVHNILRCRIPVPEDAPLFLLYLTRTHLQLGLTVMGASGAEPHIPYGMNGAAIYYAIRGPGETPPSSGKELVEWGITSRARSIIKGFSSHDEGKRVYIALRWENWRGERGPYSDMVNIVLP
jgi:hypothetical protein